jgi:hypothetical protein
MTPSQPEGHCVHSPGAEDEAQTGKGPGLGSHSRAEAAIWDEGEKPSLDTETQRGVLQEHG